MKQLQEQAERALQYVDHNRLATPQESRKWIYAANDLTLKYGTKTAYRNVTFCIPEKRLTAIIGPSGCGKSSLLMTLGGFINKIAGSDLSGQVLFNDQPIYGATTHSGRCGTTIGYVFQKPVPFPVSIYKNMTLALRDYGVTRRGDLDERVEKGLRQVGLWDEVKDRLKDSALTLSGGQQQRLCIARALTLEPSVLLMDEPCSALDPIASRVVEALIKNLSRTYTVIVVTHNLAQARRVSDDVAFFWVKDDAGVLVEHGTTADIFENPQDALTQAYVRGYSG